MPFIAVQRKRVISIDCHTWEGKHLALLLLNFLWNRIEADHRQIKQGVRVMQRFQVVRNAQVIRVGIELAYHFGKEKTA